MKKHLLSILFMTLPVFVLCSCEKESEGLTRTTVYPVLVLDGGKTVFVNKGDAYAEPGYSATIGDAIVTDQVVVTNTVDINKSGVYSVDYKITNKDGFSDSASRKVIVLDPDDPAEGLYSVDPESYRNYSGNKVRYGGGGKYEFIVLNKGDYYEFDDLFAGWYAQRAEYGSDYAMKGYVTIADDGTMTLLYSYVTGWKDSLDGMSADSRFDFTTHVFTYSINYSHNAMTFNVTATRK